MTPEQRRSIEQDCARLVALYANLNDAGNWTALVELYADDGRTTRPTAPDDWSVGRAPNVGGVTARPPRVTRHLCTNIVIDVVSEREARGESAMALFQPGVEPKLGTFHDLFLKTPAGWQFAERRGTLRF